MQCARGAATPGGGEDSTEGPRGQKRVCDQDLTKHLASWIKIPDGPLREEMEDSADALDAVLCAFPAIAVSTNQLARTSIPTEEGEIAVHKRIESKFVCAAGG
jgi:hypothetical protein